MYIGIQVLLLGIHMCRYPCKVGTYLLSPVQSHVKKVLELE